MCENKICLKMGIDITGIKNVRFFQQYIMKIWLGLY